MFAPDPCCAVLTEMSQCAYRLGLVFAAEAERAEGTKARLEYFHLFDRCFFSVRVATALKLRLRREPVREAPAEREGLVEREDLRDRLDPPERDGPRDPDRHDERDRDRDREVEPASLPLLLRTLDGVVADAAALPGREPAALAPLRALLAAAAPDAPSATVRPQRPDLPRRPDLRTRLAASAVAPVLAPAPPTGRPVQPRQPAREATGPPHR